MLGGLMGGAGGGAGGIGGLLGGILGGGGGGAGGGLGGLGGLIGGLGGGGGGLGGILRSITGGGMGGLGGMPGGGVGGGGGGGGIRRRGGGGGIPGGGGGGGDGGGGGGGPLGSLAEQRAKFAEELKNPETRRLLAASAAAEVGGQGAEATQSYIESVLNRASSRGKSLTATLRDPHYYPSSTKSKLDRPISAAEQSRIDEITKQVTAGSNVSGFATGNESGGVHSGGAPVTRDFGRGRERFVQENADKKWVQRQIAAAGGGGGRGQKYASLGGGGGGDGGGTTHGVPSQFAGDLTAMTLAGAQPHNIHAYMMSHGINLSEATCGQFMASVVKEHGGVPPQNPAVASNWNQFGGAGGAGYSADPNAINIAVKQGTRTGDQGSHVTGAVPIFGKDGQITGFRGVGVNQGQGYGPEHGVGQYGRDVISSKPLNIGTGPGQYQIRHETIDPQAQRLARDGSALDRTHRIEGSANIDVNVNAPHGTNVRARSAGLFKQTRLTRQTQMPLAEAGPAGPASIA
jgi:hypothetical protein